MTTNLPLPFKTTADFEYLRRVIMREETDGPVPIIEMMADPSFMGRVTGQDSPIDQMPEISEMYWSGEISREEADIKYYQFVDLVMAFHRAMGYDSALGFTGMNVPRTRSVFSWGDGQESTRPWQNEHSGQITDRASFEAFPWPDVTSVQVDSSH